MNFSRISILLILSIISSISPLSTTSLTGEESSGTNTFQLIQNPSGTQIPIGESIAIELWASNTVFKDIKTVFLFCCVSGSKNICFSNPINMSKIRLRSSFHHSWTPDYSASTLLKYRFIAYYVNGSPFCFPTELQSVNDPRVTKDETGLYCYTIEIITTENTFTMPTVFSFAAVTMTFIAFVTFTDKKLQKNKEK